MDFSGEKIAEYVVVFTIREISRCFCPKQLATIHTQLDTYRIRCLAPGQLDTRTSSLPVTSQAALPPETLPQQSLKASAVVSGGGGLLAGGS